MSKKVIIFVAVFISLLVGGTAVADVNGYFSGYPIVNVKVNGNTITGDTPAISFNGRTMVPVRFVSEAMGATVNWDGNTETALVTTGANSTTSNLSNAISTIVYYSYIEDQYNRLSNLGNLLIDDNDRMGNAATSINVLQDTQLYNLELDNFNKNINLYNGWVSDQANFLADARNHGLSIEDINTILNYYQDSINNYRQAYSYLSNYSSTRNMSSWTNYLTYRQNGYLSAIAGQKMASDGYNKYYEMIQASKYLYLK